MLAGALDAQGPPPGAIHLRIRCDEEIVYFKVGLQVRSVRSSRPLRNGSALEWISCGSASKVLIGCERYGPYRRSTRLANLVLIDCFVRETEAEERRRMAAADAASRPMNAAVVVATPEELAAIAERRDERRAVEAGRRAAAAAAAERARGGRRRGDQGRRGAGRRA